VQFRDRISKSAERYDLPAELVAAVIVNHQAKISSRDRFTDCVGSALGADVSVGLAQVRLSTAARLDGAELEGLTASEYRGLRSRLLDPEQNIAYQARELRALLEQEHRFPGIGAQALIHDPYVMALLVTEYRIGRLETPNGSSRLSGAAFDALRWIEQGSVDLFDRIPAEMAQIRSEVRAYLRHIYCDSGIFNSSACEAWTRFLGGRRPEA
jgi:hypothetical protein